MRSTKANIAGLTSPLQQAEMKSILAGAWPPLKPLPVFKYETAEYRATIDFDKKRGEWVCRKISLPSNQVQELRGGLREITLALPHGETEMLTGGGELQEQEQEKDTNRRLQAFHDWREHNQNGALYFELRDYLSESQRTEIDDSLRLSLTARQLQCNPKNVAYVFDVLSTAGGRFATLIEFAKRKKEQETAPEAQEEGVVPETEPINQDGESLAISPCEPLSVANTDNLVVLEQEAAERCTEAGELSAVSIKNVFLEQDQATSAECLDHAASQQIEIDDSEIAHTDSATLVEHPDQEGHHPMAYAGFPAQVQAGQASVVHSESSSSYLPVLEISAFQVAVFSALFLSAPFAFTVGLNMGRGPLASRLREAPKSMLGMDAKSPTLPDQAEPSAMPISVPAATSANESGSPNRPREGTRSEKKAEENTRSLEYVAKPHSTGADSSESTVSPKRKVSLERGAAAQPEGLASGRLTSTIGGAQSSPRASSILVTRPGRGGQPFRVSFPEKTIASTSSVAMSSQFSVLVSAGSGSRVAHKAARLEAGDLVSFVWPRYSRSWDRNRSAETIRVRVTIGPLGQVREVKFLSGARSLLPATKAAIRQWRYRPTLFDKRPVQAQQDVTIELRPPQYSSQVSTQHPSHN